MSPWRPYRCSEQDGDLGRPLVLLTRRQVRGIKHKEGGDFAEGNESSGISAEAGQNDNDVAMAAPFERKAGRLVILCDIPSRTVCRKVSKYSTGPLANQWVEYLAKQFWRTSWCREGRQWEAAAREHEWYGRRDEDLLDGARSWMECAAMRLVASWCG